MVLKISSTVDRNAGKSFFFKLMLLNAIVHSGIYVDR